MGVLRDSLGQMYRKVTLLQALLAAVTSTFALIVDGLHSALSAGAGGLAVLCGGALYAVIARESALVAVTSGRVLGRLYAAEAAKVFCTLALVLLALASGWFVAGWLVAAMGVVLTGHWLALLIIR